MARSISSKFCDCIKKVRKTVKTRKNSTKEKAAIGICVKSVLQTRGRTLKRFKCKPKETLLTQFFKKPKNSTKV
jgi:hypothetical protein